jgi:hypothetical protein
LEYFFFSFFLPIKLVDFVQVEVRVNKTRGGGPHLHSLIGYHISAAGGLFDSGSGHSDFGVFFALPLNFTQPIGVQIQAKQDP